MNSQASCLLVALNSDDSSYCYGLFCLTAYLRKHSPSISVAIADYPRAETAANITRHILSAAPAVVGFSAFVWNVHTLDKIIRRVRSANNSIRIVVGGPSAEYLSSSPLVDHIVIGDGEKSLQAIIEGHDVPRTVEQPFHISQRCFPYYDDELMKMAKSRDKFFVEASSGCPFSCAYCEECATPLQNKDLSTFTAEIQYLRDHGVTSVDLLDANLNLQKHRMDAVVRVMRDCGMKFFAEVKPELIDRSTVDLLRNSTVGDIEVGLQSSKPATNTLLRRTFDRRLFIRNVKMLEEVDANLGVDTMCGLPNETLYDWLDTVELACNNFNARVFSSILRVLPRSQLMREFKKYGYIFHASKRFRISRSNSITRLELRLAEVLFTVIETTWNRMSNEKRSALQQMVRDRRLRRFAEVWRYLLISALFPRIRWNAGDALGQLLADEAQSLCACLRSFSLSKRLKLYLTVIRTSELLRRYASAESGSQGHS